MRSQQQVRDNQIIIQKAWLGLSDGHDQDVNIQYHIPPWQFPLSDTKRLNSEEKFKETVFKYYMKTKSKSHPMMKQGKYIDKETAAVG